MDHSFADSRVCCDSEQHPARNLHHAAAQKMDLLTTHWRLFLYFICSNFITTLRKKLDKFGCQKWSASKIDKSNLWLILPLLTILRVPRSNGVMDSTLADCAGGPGLIPIISKSNVQYSDCLLVAISP